MEYILQNTDIFDDQIAFKFNQLIKKGEDRFVNGTGYKMTVTFHVNLLNDPRFEHCTNTEKTNKGTIEDKITDVLSYQLKELEQILDTHGIEVYSVIIQGDYIAEDMINIEILEDTSEPPYSIR